MDGVIRDFSDVVDPEEVVVNEAFDEIEHPQPRINWSVNAWREGMGARA